jgi:transcriptional regulator of met regulon
MAGVCKTVSISRAMETDRTKQLCKEVNGLLHTMLINYEAAVESLIHDSTEQHKLANDTLLIKTRGSNIVSSAERILTIIGEVKQAIVLNDIHQSNQLLLTRKHHLKEGTKACIRDLENCLAEFNEVHQLLQETL